MAKQPTRGSPEPYGSAKDLPSYQEMSQLVQGGKLLTLFVARDQRKKLLELEQEMDHLTGVVDRFYDRLGSRNWIFHDRLSVTAIEAILDETANGEAAELRLIDLYRNAETTDRWLMGFRAEEGLRMRLDQIERAMEHYQVDQFDSCVFHLVAVMEGFLNDFEPGVRKGLSARNPDDMTAWDSVVGHHMGLTHVMKTFTETKKKRIDDEVFEVYRHGIMHGSVVNFDNVVVATKAWNMLFAVADWAKATQKAAEPRDPEPSWADTWSLVKRHAAYKKYEREFVASTITPSDSDFEETDAVLRAREFLAAWQHRRWGHFSKFIPPVLVDSMSAGEMAAFARDTFEQHDLEDWEITSLTFGQASTADVRGMASINDETREMHLRMILWTADGKLAMPNDDAAVWRFAIWAPHIFFKDGAD